MTQQIRRFWLLPIVALLLWLTPQSTAAQVKSFYWERYDVAMTLLENGDLQVVETQTLNFSGAPFTFGFGTIPTGLSGANDGITNVQVTGDGRSYTRANSGNTPGTFTVGQEGDEIVIYWYFEPTVGSHTYEFSYTVQGGVRVGSGGDSGDQIFWKAIPSDRGARVEAGEVSISLPEGVTPQRYTETNNYLVESYINGDAGQGVDIRVSEDGRFILYTLTQPLLAYDLLEVRVQFPHGILDIATPDWQRQEQTNDAISLTVLVISLLVLVGGPLLVLALWYTSGRDPDQGIIVPEFLSEPPSALPPAVVGTLIDEKADMRDILSTLVDLSERGYMTIEEEKNNHIFRRTEKPMNDLRPFERQFLKDIFRSKDERSLNSLRYKFHDKLPNLRKLLYQELVNDGLMPRSPQSVRTNYMLLGGAVLALAIGSMVVLGALLGDSISTLVCLPMAIGFTAVILFIIANFMPAKTRKGAEEKAKWEAFAAYLKNIDKYQNMTEAKDIFAKYLPYATAFGMERSWIRKFTAVPATPIPPWYHPYGRPRPIWHGAPGTFGSPGGGSAPSLEGMAGGLSGGLESMSSSLTRMLNSTSTIMKSTPPSSSSSSGGGGFSGGFSGGGFSGGGGSRGFG